MVPNAPDFAKMVPGFDFLQGLVKNAGSVLPNIGQWVAPTIDPDELEKRIGELRTVQFWLEQNARMLGATNQALEVQRMTLSTLQTMNVQASDLREALKIKLPEQPAAAAKHAAFGAGQDKPGSNGDAAKPAASRKPAAAGAMPQMPGGAVDPVQWWGALTRQFTELATTAMKDAGAEPAADLMKKGMDAAQQSLQTGMENAQKTLKTGLAAAQEATQRAPRKTPARAGTAAKTARASSARKPAPRQR